MCETPSPFKRGIDPRLKGPSMWSIWRCGSFCELSEERDVVSFTGKKSPLSLSLPISVVQSDRCFSPLQTLCYFEVTILKAESKGMISVGLSSEQFGLNNNHCGSSPESYGYFATGIKSKSQHRKHKKSICGPYGPPYAEGDVIGCGLNNSTHEIFFTYNGMSIKTAFTRVFGSFYPTVSISMVGAEVKGQFGPPFTYPLYLNSAPPEVVGYFPRGLDESRTGTSLRLLEDNMCVEYINKKEGFQGVSQADQPLNPAKDLGYFEVEILDTGQKGYIAVGITTVSHDLDVHPGWCPGSWAYHGDDGRKFGENGAGENFGPSYGKFDVIGCAYDFIKKEMFFTKNGVFLGIAFSFSSTPGNMALFPTVGLSSLGEKVRLRFTAPFVFQSDYFDLERSRRILPEQNNEIPKDVSSWTSEEVASWISNIVGLPQYRECFIENDVSGKVLKTLTLRILKDELGVKSYGHRVKIVQSYAKIIKRKKKNKEKKSSVNKFGIDNNTWQRPKKDSIDSSLLSKCPTLEIRHDDLRIYEVLGKGFFGEVRRAVYRGTEVAIKIIYRNSFRSSSDRSVFEKEIHILSLLRHPCIVQFMGICIDQNFNCIITEYMAGGNLEKFTTENFDILEENPYLRLKIILNIVKGMRYLHGWNPPILHRDLTPRNILLDKHFTAKVADFGLSRLKEEAKMTKAVGYLPYQAPEVFKGDRYTEMADIFSFGMILWFLFSGRDICEEGSSPLKVANMIAHNDFRPAFPDFLEFYWKDHISMCWAAEPKRRPNFVDILCSLETYRDDQFPEDEKERGYLFDLSSPRSSSEMVSPLGSSPANSSEFESASPSPDGCRDDDRLVSSDGSINWLELIHRSLGDEDYFEYAEKKNHKVSPLSQHIRKMDEKRPMMTSEEFKAAQIQLSRTLTDNLFPHSHNEKTEDEGYVAGDEGLSHEEDEYSSDCVSGYELSLSLPRLPEFTDELNTPDSDPRLVNVEHFAVESDSDKNSFEEDSDDGYYVSYENLMKENHILDQKNTILTQQNGTHNPELEIRTQDKSNTVNNEKYQHTDEESEDEESYVTHDELMNESLLSNNFNKPITHNTVNNNSTTQTNSPSPTPLMKQEAHAIDRQENLNTENKQNNTNNTNNINKQHQPTTPTPTNNTNYTSSDKEEMEEEINEKLNDKETNTISADNKSHGSKEEIKQIEKEENKENSSNKNNNNNNNKNQNNDNYNNNNSKKGSKKNRKQGKRRKIKRGKSKSIEYRGCSPSYAQIFTSIFQAAKTNINANSSHQHTNFLLTQSDGQLGDRPSRRCINRRSRSLSIFPSSLLTKRKLLVIGHTHKQLKMDTYNLLNNYDTASSDSLDLNLGIDLGIDVGVSPFFDRACLDPPGDHSDFFSKDCEENGNDHSENSEKNKHRYTYMPDNEESNSDDSDSAVGENENNNNNATCSETNDPNDSNDSNGGTNNNNIKDNNSCDPETNTDNSNDNSNNNDNNNDNNDNNSNNNNNSNAAEENNNTEENNSDEDNKEDSDGKNNTQEKIADYWCVYVNQREYPENKPIENSDEEIIEKVIFRLSPSYVPSVVIIEKPPFQIDNCGSSFVLDVTIFLHNGKVLHFQHDVSFCNGCSEECYIVEL